MLQMNKLDHADVPQWEGTPKEYGGPIKASQPRETTVECVHWTNTMWSSQKPFQSNR